MIDRVFSQSTLIKRVGRKIDVKREYNETGLYYGYFVITLRVTTLKRIIRYITWGFGEGRVNDIGLRKKKVVTCISRN